MKGWAMNETRRKPQTWQKRAFPRIGCWQRGQSLGMAQEDRPMGRGLAIGMLLLLTLPGCATLAEQDQQRREIIDHENRIRALEAADRNVTRSGGD